MLHLQNKSMEKSIDSNNPIFEIHTTATKAAAPSDLPAIIKPTNTHVHNQYEILLRTNSCSKYHTVNEVPRLSNPTDLLYIHIQKVTY